MEIDDLVLAVQGGDSRAWTELALRLAADLRPFFRRWFDEDEVKDLVQTTLMTVHRKLPQFEVRPGEPFRNWVRKIARIEAQEALRQRARARRLAAAAEIAAARPTPSAKVSWLDRSRLWRALRAALAKLSSRYRVVIENDLEEGNDVALARRHRIVPGTERLRAAARLSGADIRPMRARGDRACSSPTWTASSHVEERRTPPARLARPSRA